MPEIMVFILGVIFGSAAVFLFTSKRACPVCTTSKIGTHVDKQQTEKQTRKEKILAMLHEKGSVTNNDIERVLSVSDASATNYLQELEREGKIEQVGERGRFVSYRLKK